MEELISVIVPVYKVEAYLDRCISSIVNQTYRNLELLLVDDGSPDRCPQMCDEWAKRDDRIRVIHQENRGAGAARNRGLDQARGEWIAFADSDDYLSEELYSHLAGLLARGADIAECAYAEVTGDDCSFLRGEEQIRCFFGAEAMEQHIRDGIFRQLIWNKLYRREMIGPIRFPEDTRIDDEFFTWKVLANAKLLIRSELVGYAYRQQPQSIMHTISPERRLEAVTARCRRHDYLAEHFPELIPQSLQNLWFTCLYQGQRLLREEPARQDILEALEQTLRSYSLTALPEDCTWKSRFWLKLAQGSFAAACRLRNTLRIGL